MHSSDTPSNPSHPARSAHHALLFGRPRVPRRDRWFLALAAVAIALAAAAVLIFGEFDWRGVLRDIAGWPPVPLLAGMAALPLLGFPVLPVYLVAGLRFGTWGGGLAVAFASAAHLLGAYAIGRTFLRRPMAALLARWHAHLPHVPRDEQAAVAFVAALVPGMPYAVRTYLFALIGLRLRVYFWIALPIYVARSYVSILVGELGADPDRGRLWLLGGVEALKVAVCAAVIAWLRAHHRRVHGRRTADRASS